MIVLGMKSSLKKKYGGDKWNNRATEETRHAWNRRKVFERVTLKTRQACLLYAPFLNSFLTQREVWVQPRKNSLTFREETQAAQSNSVTTRVNQEDWWKNRDLY